MKKVIAWIRKYWPSKRKWMQLYFAVLFNANLRGFVTGSIYKGNTKVLCAPGINCYSCPGAIGACPLGSLQGAMKERSSLYYMAGTLFLYGIMFGRTICGWMCPFGLIQELFYKIKTPKLKKSPVTRALSYLKFLLIPVTVILLPLITGDPTFCKYICPAGVVEAGIPMLSYIQFPDNLGLFARLAHGFTWKFLVMVAIIVACIFVFRFFCRFLCPLGALYGLFNRISLFGIKLNRDKCVDCNKCIAHCKMDIRRVGDPECISCGECAAVCPTQAIEWKVGGIRVKANELPEQPPKKSKKVARLVTRILAAILMLAVLGGTITYHWFDSQKYEVNIQLDAERGNAEGNLCYAYDLEIVTTDGVTGGTIDPTVTGKITIVNFWYDGCKPCAEEMPFFNQIATDYAETVTVITVCDYSSARLPDIIAAQYPDSKMIFTRDYIHDGSDNENNRTGYYASLFGTAPVYPSTMILDENGIITHKLPQSLTYEELEAAIQSIE